MGRYPDDGVGRGGQARTPSWGFILRVTGSTSAGGLWCLFHFLFWNQFSNIYKSRENDKMTHHVTQTRLLCLPTFCQSYFIYFHRHTLIGLVL